MPLKFGPACTLIIFPKIANQSILSNNNKKNTAVILFFSAPSRGEKKVCFVAFLGTKF